MTTDAALERNPNFYRDLLDSVSDGIYFVDRQRRITFWNKGAEAISGFTSEQVIGRSCAENLLVHTDDHGCGLCVSGCPLTEAMATAGRHSAEVWLRHRDGHRVPVTVRVAPLCQADGTVVGAVESFSDSSVKLAAIERVRQLESAAFLDPLTGVGNRRLTERTLREQAASGPVAIVFFDIDDFKSVNDRYGHATGDQVLCAVAATISSTLRSFDGFGRWGGEEFVAILPGTSLEDAARVAERCRALVATAAVPDGLGGSVARTVSAGVTVTRLGETVEEALRRADEALYRAKADGRDRVSAQL